MKGNVVRIENVIALTHVYPKLEDLKKDFLALRRKKDLPRVVEDIEKVMQGSKALSLGRERNFVHAYQDELKAINQDTKLNVFMALALSETLEDFSEYFKEHSDSIEKAEDLLRAMKELGIKGIGLLEHYDFSKRKYHYSLSLKKGFCYIEGITPSKRYERNAIPYSTSDSNYELVIDLDTIENGDKDDSIYSSFIFVNNLLFDKSHLPESLDRETLTKPLQEAITYHRKRKKDIDHVIELGDAVSKLDDKFKLMKTSINGNLKPEEQEDFDRGYSQIALGIQMLQAAQRKSEEELQEQYPEMTPKVLTRAKKDYHRRQEIRRIRVSF